MARREDAQDAGLAPRGQGGGPPRRGHAPAGDPAGSGAPARASRIRADGGEPCRPREKMMSLAVTVIVATHNRAPLLGQTLEALIAQETPKHLGWEILVVDNGSTDGTLEVFRTMAMRAPGRLRYLFEPTLGKSRALNAGIAVARGAVIALTDDDVSPAVDWVAAAASVLDKWGVDGAGGRIRPRWEAEPPSWLLESPRLLDYLAIMDHDRPAMMPVPAGKYPQVWGANMV